MQHVHVHILPRKTNDFVENNEIYEKLEQHDKGENIQWRNESDMSAECKNIRKHIIENNDQFKVIY